MIPSEDLMIGNYVFDNFDAKNPYKITRISLDDFVAMSNGCNSYQPIPLTEDILLKCGFYEHKKWFTNDYITLGYITDDRWMQFEYSVSRSVIDIKYLHQLQNLYFALKNKELQVKL